MINDAVLSKVMLKKHDIKMTELLAVIRPCSGMICNNNAACVADLSDQPPTGKCICQSGYDGADCSQGNSIFTSNEK